MTDQITFPFEIAPKVGQAITIAPGVLWLRLPMPSVLDHVNIYAFEDAEGWTLVDCGMYGPDAADLWQKICDGPLAGRPVRRVIVTHHHHDHMGMAPWLMARGAELWTSRTAWLSARLLQLDLAPRHSAESLAFWQRAGADAAMMQARAESRPFNTADLSLPLPQGYRRLCEGDRIDFGGRQWQVHVGHGHAPEHLTLWCKDFVLAGDQILPAISSNVSVYATEPEANPLAEWLESCARLRALDRGQLVLPGHKRPFYGAAARLTQLIEGHGRGLERLEAHLEQPRDLRACYPMLYKRPIGPDVEAAAMGEAYAHLNYLWHAGRITRHLSPEGVWLWQRAAPPPSGGRMA